MDLRFQRDGLQPAFVSSANAERMDVTARDVVEVFELVIFTPLHEMTEARLARIQRSLCDFVASVIAVQFNGVRGAYGFQPHGGEPSSDR